VTTPWLRHCRKHYKSESRYNIPYLDMIIWRSTYVLFIMSYERYLALSSTLVTPLMKNREFYERGRSIRIIAMIVTMSILLFSPEIITKLCHDEWIRLKLWRPWTQNWTLRNPRRVFSENKTTAVRQGAQFWENATNINGSMVFAIGTKTFDTNMDRNL